MQTVACPHNDGQRDALMVIEGHLPAITVAKVFKNELLGIELVVGSCFGIADSGHCVDSFGGRCGHSFVGRCSVRSVVGCRRSEGRRQRYGGEHRG